MERKELAGNRPRNAVLRAAIMSCCLLLGAVGVEVATTEGSTPRRARGRRAPSYFLPTTPEEQGMDSVLLGQAIDYLVSERDLYYIHSLSIVRHGHMVADVYLHPYPPGTMHNLASTTKVFMTTLIGVAIDKGYIANVDERVVDFFPDRTIANLDDRKRAMTLHHLLTMTSGLGSDIERIYLEALDSYIFPAVQSSAALPPNPAGVAQLDHAIQRAASPDRGPQPVDPFPAIAAVVSGTTYVLHDNPFELHAGTLRFPFDDEARFRIVSSGRFTLDPDFEWAAGLDGIERLGEGQLGIPEAGTGGWQDDQTFVMNVDLMGMLERFRLTFTFEEGGNRLSLMFEDMDWWMLEPPIVLTGTAQP